MNKAQFDDAFETGVARPLGDVGFKPCGKSLAFKDALITIALIRLGGRLACPGCVSHVICFRHSFLRDRSESVPEAAPSEPFDYPFKFGPSEPPPSGYRPQNLRYPYDVVEWSPMEERELSRWTAALTATIIDKVVPWAQAMTPRAVRDQLRRYGENAWCERLWIEDYDQALEGTMS